MEDLWQKIAADIGKSPVVAAWFTAGGALLGVVLSAIVSYLVAHRSVYINAVTAERSKWIDALRTTISAYSGAAGKISAKRSHQGRYEKSPEWATDTEVLQTLLSDLTLRLNPTEDEALNLLRAAKMLDQAARIHRPADFILANEIMIRHAQWVAKAEWERVKEEASGWPATLRYARRNRRRRRAYAAFLKADGDLSQLDLIGSGQSELAVTLARSRMDTPR